MRVLLKVWSSNPDYSGGCDYAVVEMSGELAKLSLRRISILKEQSAVDPSLYETYYWEPSAEYFGPYATPRSQPGERVEPDEGLALRLESLEVDTKEIVIAPPDFRVPESHVVAVECAQMVVRDGAVAFTALLRHSDIYLTTAEIPKQIIESAHASAA